MVVVALGAAACSQQDSDGILTSAVFANFTLHAEGDGSSRASGTLRVGGADSLTFLNLVGDDRLTATLDGTTRPMSETELLDVISYAATFDADAEDTEVTFALVRTIDQGAPASTATLPAPFTLTAPPSASRAAALELDLDAGVDDPTAWEAHGTCITAARGVVPQGADTITIPAGTITAVAGQEAETCDVEITVTRTRQGTLDPAFEGGGSVGEQERAATVSVTP